MTSQCFVSANDYDRYWRGRQFRAEDVAPEVFVPPPADFDGDERRKADRRAPGHERRWEACRGRRWEERRRR